MAKKTIFTFIMLKRYTIFFFLAAAYSVLLAHNFTPHQHHKTAAINHHHDHDKHSHDDHDDDSEHNTGPFHHFQHIAESGIEYTSGNFFKSFGLEKSFKEFCNRPEIIVLHPIQKPLLIAHFERSGQVFLSQKIPYFFQLKAPPAFTA